MTWQARNAEEALLGALNCCAFVTQTASKIAWPDDFALSGLLGRVDHRRSERVARYCLGWLDATTEERKHDLYQAEFIYAHLQASNLSRSHLTRANLAGANLVDANLSWGHLEGAHYFASNLSNTNLNGAFLTEATLEKTNLEGAILKGAHLEGASLEGANVTDTDLADATLEGVDLTRIRNLDRARNLHRVKSWHGATIERKWIPHLERLGLVAEELKMEVVPDSEN